MKIKNFVGLENFYNYFASPALLSSIFNSVWVACAATVITVFLASIYAFALTNVNIKGKGFFKLVAFFTHFSAITFAFFGIGLFVW